jgi:hypothetical protein
MVFLGLACLMAPMSAGADKPIPQDQASTAKYLKERLEWNRRTLQGAYGKVGKRDPKWDKQADGRDDKNASRLPNHRRVHSKGQSEEEGPGQKKAVIVG